MILRSERGSLPGRQLQSSLLQGNRPGVQIPGCVFVLISWRVDNTLQKVVIPCSKNLVVAGHIEQTQDVSGTQVGLARRVEPLSDLQDPDV